MACSVIDRAIQAHGVQACHKISSWRSPSKGAHAQDRATGRTKCIARRSPSSSSNHIAKAGRIKCSTSVARLR